MTLARFDGGQATRNATTKPSFIESGPVMAAGLALAILAFTLAFFADTAGGDTGRSPPVAERLAQP